jgi:crotonyl-CoA carboxylase/reductase
MALDTNPAIATYDAPKKDLYEMGEIPPMGHVPPKMYAWTIRRERHGEPDKAFEVEVVDTWSIDSNEVLVLVMAAGVNYNGVWAGLGQPISPFDGTWRALPHRRLRCGGHRLGRGRQGQALEGRATRSSSTATRTTATTRNATAATRCSRPPSGSGATRRPTAPSPVHPRAGAAADAAPQAPDLGGSACYTLTLATAYRMLFGHHPHELKPGQNVLVWGASGGLGVLRDPARQHRGRQRHRRDLRRGQARFVMGLGAKGVINRKDFNCWGQLPKVNTPEYKEWFTEARKFGKAIWDITGKGVNVDMVFEHPGEATFPVSTFVCKRGGMVVICAGTTGFNCTFDVRYMWMHQKRLQGSHFAHLKQAASANKLMVERRLDPCMSEVFPWDELPQAH